MAAAIHKPNGQEMQVFAVGLGGGPVGLAKDYAGMREWASRW